MSSLNVADESQDVNDVLASIRKLVSEEAQARSQDTLKLSSEQEADDTLMLTPAHKVASETTDGPLVLEKPEETPITDAIGEELAAPFQDEVALRALVGEMIREELQGELGNRITRNVKKLVRREIEVALKNQNT